MAARWATMLVLAGLTTACDLYLPSGEDESAAEDVVTRQARLAAISQAPYQYRRATYWTLANGCTYSPAPSATGGWRWFLVHNPMSPERPMVHEGCSYVFDAGP